LLISVGKDGVAALVVVDDFVVVVVGAVIKTVAAVVVDAFASVWETRLELL